MNKPIHKIMKRVIFLSLLFVLLSCDNSDKVKDCELNQTYTLVFYNPDLMVKSLYINGTVYDVSINKEIQRFTVPVNSDIRATYRVKRYGIDTKPYYKDTTVRMQGRPNVCSTYNYFW